MRRFEPPGVGLTPPPGDDLRWSAPPLRYVWRDGTGVVVAAVAAAIGAPADGWTRHTHGYSAAVTVTVIERLPAGLLPAVGSLGAWETLGAATAAARDPELARAAVDLGCRLGAVHRRREVAHRRGLGWLSSAERRTIEAAATVCGPAGTGPLAPVRPVHNRLMV